MVLLLATLGLWRGTTTCHVRALAWYHLPYKGFGVVLLAILGLFSEDGRHELAAAREGGCSTIDRISLLTLARNRRYLPY